MKYKKHMIILLAAIFLFAMATASAADSNDTAVAAEDRQLTDEIIQASENQENTIQASNNDEVNLSEDDSGKLAIGNDKTLGKTVTNHTFDDINREIESDCTIYLEPGNYTGDNRIRIFQKSNITIIGNSTILDAQRQTRIFYISQSSNITIQNIIFKNGYTGSDGGAIEVYYSCRDCSISNCTFINNTAEGDGGAIEWSGLCANGRVSNCTFINNTAKEDGGAINWLDSIDGRVNNCTFINNTAEDSGDAIFASACDLNADYNWFGNTADNYNDQLPINRYVKCDYRLFLNATANPDTITGKDTSNVTFKLYQYHSGVVSDYDNAPFKNLDLTITATKGNVKGTAKLGEPIQFTPTGKGTASVTATVENVRQTAEINVLKGDFDLLQDLVNNESLSVINLERNYTYNEFDTITDGVRINRPITINGNGYIIDAKGKSRIFYVTAGSINITNVTLKNGKAYRGGAIYFENDIYNSNINATYINNTAEQNGGANHFWRSVLGSNVSGTFINNTAEWYGGANHFDSVSTSNVSGTYINNTAKEWGGANYFDNKVSGSNVSGTYINNKAEGNGGANFFDSVSGSNVSGTYINNKAEWYGGANFFDSVSTSNISGTYINNKAEGNGGANYFVYSVSTSNISGIYISNTASNAVIHFEDDYNYGLDADITNAIFLNNNCTYEISARTQGIVVKDSWFGNNASNYMNKPNINDEVQMDSWLFLNGTNNQNNIKFFLMGYDGTTVSEYDNTLMPKINLTIATTDGILDKSTVDLDEPVKFSPTKSGINRVTAQIEDATQTIEFTNGDFDVLQTIVNNATSSVINLTRNYTYNEFDTITEGVRITRPITINGNGFTIDAKGKSSIFYVTAGSINITDITLKNGKAYYGGAIYFENDIYNSNINATYINNTAEWDGGANYFNRVLGSNVSGTYINNTAEQVGGANNFHGTVSGSNISGTYINNTAEQDGGANYFKYNVIGSNIISGTYINNTASNAVIRFEDYHSPRLDAYIKNAIFLNNNCTYEISARIFGVELKDSWFGNNASNFMNKPNVNYKVTVDNWLFLNATVNPSSLLILDSSKVTFKLYSTDGINVSDFDNSKLPAVNLTLTATKGDVDKTTTLDNIVKYVATEQGKGSVTAKIENASYTICLDNMLNVDLSVSAQNITYLENEILTLTYNNTATGKVNITLKSKNYKKTIEMDINRTITIADLPAGEYDVTIEYLGDNVFSNATSSAYFTVEKITTEIIPDKKTIDLFVEDKSNITYTLSPDYALGNVSFSSNDSNIASVDSESGEIMANAEGSAIITVSFSGSENYTASNATVTVNVKKIPTQITVNSSDMDMKVNGEKDVGAGLEPANAGNLTYKSSDEDIVIVENGKIKGLKEGNATITVSFAGDKKYAAAENKTIAVNVRLNDASVSVNNATLDLFVDDTFDLIASTAPEGLNVTYVPDNSGVVSVDNSGVVTALKEGTANITVKVGGDGVYAENSTTVSVNVKKIPTEITVNTVSLDLFVGDETVIAADLTPADAGNLTYTSSNTSVAIVEKGKIKALTNGTAVITVSFPGNENYTAAENKTINVTVNLKDAIISVNNSTLDLFVDDNFTVVATTSPAGLKVTFVQDDSGVYIVDENGNVAALREGTGHILVKVGGDGVYAENTTEITVSVSKIPTEITLTNETLDLKVNDMVDGLANLTPADAGNLTFISSDEEVVFVADGMILAYGKGTATVTVSFAGNDKYASAENKTITVNVSLRDASVSVENSTLDLKVDDRFDLNATTVPDWLNVEYASSDESVATVTDYGIVTAVGEGTATITLTVGDDAMFAVNSTNVAVTVSKQDSNVNVSMPENITVGENSTVNVVLPDDATGNITVNVDGEVVDTVSVTDGTADVIIPSLSAGNHTVEIDYLGDDKYNSASKTATITVNKYSTNITAADVTATYKVNKYMVINLTDSNGNPLANSTVTVELSTAKNYTSDENGQIKVKVSSLVPKTYTAKITFKGDDKYAGSETTAKVTVKKATAKITAKVKTFKTTTKTKKYTVMLKANGKALKNKWVYLKVNGKTYKAKTNSKGKATFKITQLNKAGKFKATVTFKGNDYYKKATKKATIKVKSVWKTVQKGSKNSAIVKKIQRALKNHGYYLEYNGRYLKVDGIFWDYTEMAVKEFQNDKTLKVTGKVDEKTAKKLGII